MQASPAKYNLALPSPAKYNLAIPTPVSPSARLWTASSYAKLSSGLSDDAVGDAEFA